jgi:hypothetical protein
VNAGYLARQLALVKAVRLNKYAPHQGDAERRRRLRQVRRGQLSGGVADRGGLSPFTGKLAVRPASEFVTDAARYAAHGLVSPDNIRLVKEG